MDDKVFKYQVGKNERGKGLAKSVEKAVLVSVHLPSQNEEQVKEYLDELEFLALTAGAETASVTLSERVKWRKFRNISNRTKILI